MKPQLSIGITTSYPTTLLSHAAVTADKYQLKGVWLGDDIGGPHDIFTSTSTVLSYSRTIEAGIGIVSPLYHNLSTIARASTTLTELYGGRFRLGLGVGSINVLKERGIPIKRTVESIGTAVTSLRKLFSGEKISSSTLHYNLTDYSVWDEYPIPIYLGVRGPKLLQLASDIADGIILSSPKPYLSEASKIFKHAQSSRGFKIVGWLPTILGEGDGSLVEHMKKVVAVVVADTPNNMLESSHLDLEKVKQIRQSIQVQRWDRAIKLIDKEFAEAFLIYGSSETLVDKMVDWARSAGMDEIIFGPPYGHDPVKAIEEVASLWVI